MAIITYGKLEYQTVANKWVMTDVKPHVCIKLKAMFPRIPKASPAPFYFDTTTDTAHDLLWFMERYPMKIAPFHQKLLLRARKTHLNLGSKLDLILRPDHVPGPIALKDGHLPRDYQLRAAEFDEVQRRWLLGDDVGLGKTLEAVLTLMNPNKLPAMVCVQAHLPKQWIRDGIEKFTTLKAHIIKQTQPYALPSADIYLISYSKLSGWVDVLTGFIRAAVFDEVQELRRPDSQKYRAAYAISDAAQYCLGMSATPVYNFGDEIFSVLDLIKPGCLGERWDFLREWATHYGNGKFKVTDPAALGTYLRDNYLFLRRTRREVGRELPAVNTIVHTVGHDEQKVRESRDLARQLAIKVISGAFVERGQAARELDALVRHETGVSKAREVAAFVSILLENNEPVLLAGWHRDVYDIWLEELKDFNPILYTGSESPAAKEKAKNSFLAGETNLFIISLRSGIGLDGLQARCKTVVHGELDWSPMVHHQVKGRIDRDGQEDQVTEYYLVSEYGSDPVIVDLLALKSSQAHGIINPLEAVPQQFSDESRIKILAESFLAISKDGHMHTKLNDDNNNEPL